MQNERQAAILNYLAEKNEAKNEELLQVIGNYSMMTLWRDLAKLEQDGKIIRIRGGAILASPAQNGIEPSLGLRMKQNISEKEDIAKIALTLIETNRAYYMDAGSTIYTLAKHLQNDSFTVITSAANIACELVQHNKHSITLLGGQMNSVTLSCSGPQAMDMLDEMNIDIALMATSGFSQHSGFSSGCLAEAQLKNLVIKKARLSVMLMDYAKISKNHPFTFANLDDIDVVIGDQMLSSQFISEAEEHGILVFTPRDGLSEEERVKRFKEKLNEGQ